jgi:hypothetical protein
LGALVDETPQTPIYKAESWHTDWTVSLMTGYLIGLNEALTNPHC